METIVKSSLVLAAVITTLIIEDVGGVSASPLIVGLLMAIMVDL